MKQVVVRTLQIVLPLAVLGGAGFAAATMIRARPPVEIQDQVVTPPGVRVEEVTLGDVTLSVTSQGTVRPRTESQLVTEIAGRVTWVAPSFVEGGFFELGDVLVKIDPFDYQQAVVSARSQLAQARLRLAQEEAEAEVAVREWEELGRGDPRELTLRKPQLEEARASVEGAEANLERAKRDLERAEIVAPYAGRIRQKDVDIGQFIRVGDAVATVYAIDVAEIRLPLPDEQLAYLDLPLSYRGGSDQPQPRVTLRATFAGEAHEWQGRIVRTEGEIDPVSRMVHAVAEVLDPYTRGPNQNRPPLAVGMYVEAEIAGHTARDVAVVPRAALRGRDRVLVVDAQDRLSFREIDILRATTDAIYVQGGLAEGDLVVVSPLDAPTEGMRVQLANADADLLTRRRDDAPALPASDASAPADTDRASAATAPAAADFDIDPSLSRDEQIAALRRQLERLTGTPAAPPAPATPDVSPDRPAAAPTGVADDGPGATAAGPDTAAGTRGRDGAGARVGLGTRGERRGGVGRGGAPAPTDLTTEPAARPAGFADAARSVAVLPFVNVSRNPADDSTFTDRTRSPSTRAVIPFDDFSPSGEAVPNVDLGAAITDAIAARLAELPVVTVVSSDDGAAWIVGGGVQRLGGIVRVTARLIDVESGAVLKTVEVNGTIDALAELKERVASAMSESVRDALSAQDAAAGHGTDADVASAVGRRS